MNQNEIKRLTGLAMYLENDTFYSLIKTPEFKTYLLENSGLISNILIESFNVSNSMYNSTLVNGSASPLNSNLIGNKESLSLPMNQSVSIATTTNSSLNNSTLMPQMAPNSKAPMTEAPKSVDLPIVAGLSMEFIENDVLETICAQTGYPKDMIEPEIDLEADLGVDTVKKMEIIAELAEKYKLQYRKDFNMASLSTVRKIAHLIYQDSHSQNERNQ